MSTGLPHCAAPSGRLSVAPLLQQACFQPPCLRQGDSWSGRDASCRPEAEAVRMSLPVKPASDSNCVRVAGKWHCHVGGQDATGPSRRHKEAVIQGPGTRQGHPPNTPTMTGCAQSSNHALDNMLTPEEELSIPILPAPPCQLADPRRQVQPRHAACLQAQKSLGSGTLLQNDDGI